jgi:tRNA 2-thiocytidine biosynthesis protein TtcA
MDAGLFDFKALRATGVADADGDIAFDEDPCAAPDAPRAGGATVQLMQFPKE